MGKALIGVEGFEYATLEEGKVKGEVKKVTGLDSAKLSVSNDNKTIFADNAPYLSLGGGISETKLEIGLYYLDSDVRKDFFGVEVEDGIEKYTKDLQPNNIACMFKTKTDAGKNVFVGLLNGKFTLPDMEAKTTEGNADASPESVEGNFVTGVDGDTIYVIGREENEGFSLEKFKEIVFPKATQQEPAK